ncbi:E3 ubiquitin-protein ligase RBBP6 [Marchantia polymorpha subsp. ruderalis]
MALHFKFRSAVEYDSVNIEGHFISVASLKDKIIEAKNLGKGTDFDLLITNAQTGEEYSDDAFLVPKNTSVIIKRVPATRAKPVLRVDDQPRSQSADQSGSEVMKGVDASSHPSVFQDLTGDSMDDFGVDLYAIPEPIPSKIDKDENSRITALVNKSAAEWQRQTQEAYAGGRGFGRLAYGRGISRGRGYGRAVPPQGYVCHRCGQPGHFIQHCPTNGDPTYDIRRVKLPVGIPKTRLKADQEGSYILPDGSVAVMQPDESVFAKEADALLSIRPTFAEPPPELRCPLCQAIFKDAVMIPCCHYSFCDKCIRQELIEKGKCPQCGSTRFKNDDLLPNIALRQAIDRFLETQGPATSAEEPLKPNQVSDLDSALEVKVPSPTVSRLQIELRKPTVSLTPPANDAVAQETAGAVDSASGNDVAVPDDADKSSPANTDVVIPAAEAKPASPVVASVEPQPQCSEAVAVHTSKADESLAGVDTAIVKDVSGYVKKGGKHPIIDDGGGMVVKTSEPPSNKEAEVVAVESEFSKGVFYASRVGKDAHVGVPAGLKSTTICKKKKKRTRLIPGDGAADYMGVGKGKRMQADRFCYICGSPEHLARDCLENPDAAHPVHPGMFGPGPGVMPPYPDMFWHGPPIPQHGRPFPMGYGEGMYGPGPGPMSFDAPMMPGGPYNVPPYMRAMYPSGPMRGGFMGGGMPPSMGAMDRPLSREEFIELQERERRRRIMQDQMQRERSPDRSFSRDGMHPQTPESDRRRYEHGERRGSAEEQHPLTRKRDLDRDSVRDLSDDTDFYKNKSEKYERKPISLVESNMYRRHASVSDDEPSFDELKSRRAVDRRQREGKAVLVGTKRESRYYRDNDIERLSSDPEQDALQQAHPVRRHEKELDVYSVKCSSKGQSKRGDDGKSMHVSASGGDSHSSRHKSKRNALVDDKYDVECSQEKSFARSAKHARCRSRSPEHDGRFHLRENSGSEVDGGDDVRDAEKRRRRKHRSHSKVKAELESAVVSISEDESKKKKKKHRKHRDEGNVVKSREGRGDGDVDRPSKHRKHRSKSDSHGVASSPRDLEDTRWQLDSGYEGALTGHARRSKHNKTQRPFHVKLKH